MLNRFTKYTIKSKITILKTDLSSLDAMISGIVCPSHCGVKLFPYLLFTPVDVNTIP